MTQRARRVRVRFLADVKVNILRADRRQHSRGQTRWGLVAFEDANGAAEGGQLDFGQAVADSAEQAFGVFRSAAAETVRVGFKEGFGAIVHGAGGGLRIEIEGISAGEANFHQAAAALHGVNTGANKITVKENVAGGGNQVHVLQRRLQDLRATADGVEVQLTRALRADKRAAGGVHDDVAGNFLQVYVAGNAFEFHVTGNLFDINQPGLSLDLQLGLFRHGELDIFREFSLRSGSIENVGDHVDAVIGLLHVQANFIGRLRRGDDHFGIFPGLHFYAAVGDVLNHHYRAALHGEMFFDFLAGVRGEGHDR